MPRCLRALLYSSSSSRSFPNRAQLGFQSWSSFPLPPAAPSRGVLPASAAPSSACSSRGTRLCSASFLPLSLAFGISAMAGWTCILTCALVAPSSSADSSSPSTTVPGRWCNNRARSCCCIFFPASVAVHCARPLVSKLPQPSSCLFHPRASSAAPWCRVRAPSSAPSRSSLCVRVSLRTDFLCCSPRSIGRALGAVRRRYSPTPPRSLLLGSARHVLLPGGRDPSARSSYGCLRQCPLI